MTAEQISAAPIRLSHSAAGTAPKPLGRNMPKSQTSRAETQHKNNPPKQYDSTVYRRTNTPQIMHPFRLAVVSTIYGQST